MAEDTGKPPSDEPSQSESPETQDRRVGDRRKAQRPFEGEDRRIGERRSGLDRRRQPRRTPEVE